MPLVQSYALERLVTDENMIKNPFQNQLIINKPTD